MQHRHIEQQAQQTAPVSPYAHPAAVTPYAPPRDQWNYQPQQPVWNNNQPQYVQPQQQQRDNAGPREMLLASSSSTSSSPNAAADFRRLAVGAPGIPKVRFHHEDGVLKYIQAPMSTPQREIVPLDVKPAKCCRCCAAEGASADPGSWCKEPSGVVDSFVYKVPDAIAARGVQQEEWTQWMLRLRQIVQETTWSNGAAACYGAMAGLLLLPLCFMCCVVPNVRERHIRIAEFTAALNEQVLQPHGMFAKTQAARYNSSNGAVNRIAMISWMAVAMTPEEADALRLEEHLFQSGSCDPEKLGPRACKCYECCCCVVPVVSDQ